LRPGDAWHNAALLPAEERFTPQPWGPGTVHVDAVDAKGNMASFTPSGAWIRSAEVIGALGFPLSTRMMTFYLGPANHPNVVAPGWTEGFTSAAQLDEETRLLEAGCDPRGSKSECFPAFAYVW